MEMKVTRGAKIAFLAIGIMLAWGALYIMFADFYMRLRQVIVASAQGGSYHLYFLKGEDLTSFIICVVISSICLAIGLKAEEPTPKEIL